MKPTTLYRLKMISPLSGDAVAMIVVKVVLFVIAWFQIIVPLKAIEIKLDNLITKVGNLDTKVGNLVMKMERLDRTTIKKFW